MQGDPYEVDIGPARGRDGAERRLPREIWLKILSFLIFEDGYREEHGPLRSGVVSTVTLCPHRARPSYKFSACC